MKGNLKRPIRVREDYSPVDAFEVVDRNDLEELRKEIWAAHRDKDMWDSQRFADIENKIKTMGIVGSVVAAALCFVMIMRKDD